MPAPANRRMPLSCEPCRERKIRCPRNSNRSRGPCETCIRRGIPPEECIYLRDIYPRRPPAIATHGAQQADDSNAELLTRVNNLEELLRAHVSPSTGRQQGQNPSCSQLPSPESLLQPQSAPASSTPRRDDNGSPFGLQMTPSSTKSSTGSLILSESGHERYEPFSSRWSSILGSSPATRGVQKDVDKSQPDSDFPFATEKADTHELMSMLPPSSYCDELKKIYFSVFAALFHVLHDPTFEVEYSHFRTDPDEVSLSWLALLYAVLSVAIMAVPEDNSLLQELGRRQTTSENMRLLSSRYRTAAMKCLEADHYLWRHNLHTLKALVILIYGINHAYGESWALLGTARNIALSLGCHVDPDEFQLDLVVAEERRRCWAGLNMLYTIQNTTMGNLESEHAPSNVKLPLDIDDDQLTKGVSVPTSPAFGPSQMSYLLIKFELYGISSRICDKLFHQDCRPSYDTITLLDREICAKQDSINYKYLLDTATSNLPDYHAVHLHVLFAYSHQLILLLHRPVLIHHSYSQADGLYTRDQILKSQNRCLESSRPLLGIHQVLHSDETYRPYRWYNRGLGSFHAFHAAVCLAYICVAGLDLDCTAVDSLRQELCDAIWVFEELGQSGMSKICQKATPILRKLVDMTGNSRSASRSSHISIPPVSEAGKARHEANSHRARMLESQSSIPNLDILADTLDPQHWLSPSVMDWSDWDTIVEGN